MDLSCFMALRQVLQSTPEQIEAMEPRGYDVDFATKRVRDLPATDVRYDASSFMRLFKEQNFRGWIVPPTTCDNVRCPMHNGQRWFFEFYLQGEPYKRQWTFYLEQHMTDTQCGDHSWLDITL